MITDAEIAGFMGWRGPAACTQHAMKRIKNAITEAEKRVFDKCIELHDAEDVLAPIGQSTHGEIHQDGWIAGTSAYRDAIIKCSNQS